MIDAAGELLLGRSSLISLVLRFIRAVRKWGLPMVLGTGSPPFSPSFPSSPTPNISSPSPRKVYGSPRSFPTKRMILASFTNQSVASSSSKSREINQTERSCPGAQRPNLCSRRPEFSPGSLHVVANRCKPVGDGESLLSRRLDSVNDQCVQLNSTMISASKGLSNKARKRPARILIPEACVVLDEVCKDSGDQREVAEVVGQEFYVASRRGRSRKNMEDKYAVITNNIASNSKQAFFGVFDGHGGQEGVDFVADRLGKNIVGFMKDTREEDGEDRLEMATKIGYKATDDDFFVQGLRGGACAATVLIKDGEAQVANVGDCRVVLSRNCLAHALTNDHRVGRHDERCRIESSGGYVNVHNGVWRVHGSLAVSRSIGDWHLKKWVISEPETSKVRLTTECQFFIIASDGLWDKVTNQEAVDVVLKHGASVESCKVLVELSCMRGNMDDVTVMVVDLGSFI